MLVYHLGTNIPETAPFDPIKVSAKPHTARDDDDLHPKLTSLRKIMIVLYLMIFAISEWTKLCEYEGEF